MSIYEMYGRLAETQETTEVSRKFLYDLVDQLRLGAIKPEQIELLEDGRFKVNSLPGDHAAVGAGKET